MDRTDVVVEIAVQLESRAVFSDDHSLSVSLDVCALVGERHFDLAAVEAQAKTWVDLDLTSVTLEGKQLANNFSTGSFLFDDGAEVVSQKVARQQEAAIAGELVEAKATPVEWNN